MDGMSDIQALTALQNEFAIYESSGELWIVRISEVEEIVSGKKMESLSFFKKTSADCLLKRHLENLAISSDKKNVINNFWINPYTKVFKGTAFSPLNTEQNIINLWVGNTATPASGDWTAIQNYLLNVIADGNHDLCEYLVKFMAHMLQKPEEKPGIMPVLLGTQGTGKGTFFRLLKKIWGKTTLQVNDVRYVVDNFNAELEMSYIVCMDEALFVGDKAKLERLKSLISEPTCRIEQKYQPSRTIQSFHRFFAASNNEQFAHIDKDDRRFVFFKVSDAKKCDTSYFNHLEHCMNDPEILGGFVQHLLTLNINDFNVRMRPKTDEQLQQKIQSLTGFERYWHEVLQTQNISGRETYGGRDMWHADSFVANRSILEHYEKFDKAANKFAPLQSSYISIRLKKICPSVIPTRSKSAWDDKVLRGYKLPRIEVARYEFENAIGHQIDWGDIISERNNFSNQYLTHDGAHP